MTPRLVVAARDAGAASALVPVVKLLEDRRCSPHIVATGRAATIFADQGISFSPLETDDEASARPTLAELRPDALLTGTSMRVAADLAWWNAARELRIPSVALLDHWYNVIERFTIERPLDSLPEVVAVMDVATREQLVDAGADVGRIVVTGHPHLDQVPPCSPKEREGARRALGISAGSTVLLFVSEPVRRFYGDSLGYTEVDAIRMFRAAVSVAFEDGVVFLRPHPLEDASDLEELTTEPGPPTRLAPPSTPRIAAAAADAVGGMRSTFLLEAARMGIRTVSVRPRRRPDRFLDAHEMEVPSGATVEQLARLLREPAPQRPRTERDAAETVLELFESLVAECTAPHTVTG